MRANYFLGSAMIVGAVLTLVGNVLHPVLPLFETAEYAREAAAPSWAALHGALITGILLFSLGFVEVYETLRMKGEPLYATVGLFSVLFAAILWTIVLGIDGLAGPLLAADYNSATGSARDTAAAMIRVSGIITLSLLVPAFLLTGVGVGSFGASLVRTRLYSRVLGGIGVVLGLLVVLGYAAGLFGPYVVGNNVFVVVASAVIIWIIGLGGFVVRGEVPMRVEAPAPERAT